MAIDFDAIRKKLGQLSGNNSKRRVMWRPPQDETTTVRIIAFTDNDGNPFKERYFYYNIGNNPGLLAPYQFGKPDPINELIQKFKGEGTKEGYEMAKKHVVNVRVDIKETKGDISRLIRKFTKKVKKERIIEDYLDKRFYEKPSAKRRKEKLKKLRNAQKAERERNRKLSIR